MTLTCATLPATLQDTFARPRVAAVIAALRELGIPQGEAYSPGHTATAVLACALAIPAAAAVNAALNMRSWYPVAPAPGWRLIPGQSIDNLRDCSLMQVMAAEILCRRPTAWQISAVEVIGAGLCFGQGDYDGRPPERIPRQWQTVPERLVSELGRKHGVATENEATIGALMLGRIARSLIADKQTEAAE